MPPKRKPWVHGRKHKTESERKHWERANENNEQTCLRLDKQRELGSAYTRWQVGERKYCSAPNE